MRLRFGAVATLLFLFWTPSAFSKGFYFDLGSGISVIESGGTFFGGGPDLTTFSTAFVLTTAYDFNSESSPWHIHAGVQLKMDNATVNGAFFSVISPYPIVRFEWRSRFFTTLGVTTILFRRNGENVNVDFLQSVFPVQAFLLEMGYVYTFVPGFGLGLSASAQFVSMGDFLRLITLQPSIISPRPIADTTLFLRFGF